MAEGKRFDLRARRAAGEDGHSAHPVRAEQGPTLADTLDRVLARGVVAHADVVLTVAEVPLVYVGLQALVSSVETAAGLADGPAGRNTDCGDSCAP